MMQKRILLKLGGASLQDNAILQGIVEAVKQFRRFDAHVVIVHGGGPAINEELTKKGIHWNFVDGQRVTTQEMMDTIEMVLGGSMNSRIVRALNAAGVPALGISGTDGGLLQCKQASAQLGQVGQIESVNTLWIESLGALPGKPVPVIAPLGVGSDGEAYNINADWAATRIASALKVDQLLFLTDQAGIWDGDKKVIHEASEKDLEALIADQVVQGGMLTKTRAVQFALAQGIEVVRVLNARDVMKGLWSDWVGTTCYSMSNMPVWLKYPPEFGETYASV